MKKIGWEKWFCPITDANELRIDEPSEEYDDDEFEGEDLAIFEQGFVLPVVKTPLGIYHREDPMLPSKMFDCWIGHSNFALSKDTLQKIGESDGVEVLRPMTRYRFFVGIGKLFNFREVRHNIEKSLGVDGQINEPDQVISYLKNHLKDYEKWAIVRHKDGDIDFICSHDVNDKEYERQLRVMKNFKDSEIIESET